MSNRYLLIGEGEYHKFDTKETPQGGEDAPDSIVLRSRVCPCPCHKDEIEELEPNTIQNEFNTQTPVPEKKEPKASPKKTISHDFKAPS